MIKHPRWNTEDFVFENEPIIKNVPKRKETFSLGTFFIFALIFYTFIATLLLMFYFSK